MSSGNEYRAKAHEAQVMELETHDPYLRRAHAKVAAHWLELAKRIGSEEFVAAIIEYSGDDETDADYQSASPPTQPQSADRDHLEVTGVDRAAGTRGDTRPYLPTPDGK